MNLYFPNGTSSFIRDGVLGGSMLLEEHAGVIEYAAIDRAFSTRESVYPDTPIGLNITVRFGAPLQRSHSMSFTDHPDIEGIAKDCGVPALSLDRHPRGIEALAGVPVRVHVGERGLEDAKYRKVHMPWVYALSFPRTSR